LTHDLAGVHSTSMMPYVLLGIALLVALGFEFVNGFHDTANAVATVIYTHLLEPHIAVVWSGFWNFSRGPGVVGLGSVWNYLPFARRIDPASRKQSGIRHGICVVGRSHHLESGHLVFWPTGFEFSYFDWVGYRSRSRQPTYVG